MWFTVVSALSLAERGRAARHMLLNRSYTHDAVCISRACPSVLPTSSARSGLSYETPSDV